MTALSSAHRCVLFSDHFVVSECARLSGLPGLLLNEGSSFRWLVFRGLTDRTTHLTLRAILFTLQLFQHGGGVKLEIIIWKEVISFLIERLISRIENTQVDPTHPEYRHTKIWYQKLCTA